jgi:RNA polymerase sigma-70 factor (ECF subfamily)
MKNITVEWFNKNVFDTYYKKVFNYILSRTGYNNEIAEDLTQEIFIKIWKNMYKYNPKKANLQTWVFKVTRNHLIDYFRKKKINKKLVQIESQVSYDNFQRDTEIDEDMRIVRHGIEELPNNYKDVLIFRYIEEMEIMEIAKIMGKSYTATKMLLSRARKKLLSKLKKMNYEF